MNKIDHFEDGKNSSHMVSGFTSLEEDKVITVGIYVKGSDITIVSVSDSGCFISVTPSKSDICEPMSVVNKLIVGIGESSCAEA